MQNCLTSVWKQNSIEITHSILHYLFAIEWLHKKNWYARGVDIAQYLWITAWSCSIGLKNLLKKELVLEDENKMISLSNSWKEVVKKAKYKKEILLNFFINTLKLDEKTAQTNACKIEHILDDSVIEAIKNLKN